MKIWITTLCACLSAMIAASPAVGTQIVQDGVAKAEIVIAAEPARMTKFAAKELQAYVKKISGAELPIVTEPSSDNVAKIYVGESSYTDALGINTEGLDHGAYRMVSGPDWLALVGPDEDFVPIEPWGRSRSPEETARVNSEWDEITGDTFWNNFRELYVKYDADLDVWQYDDTGTLNAVYDFLRSLGVRWFAPGEIGEVVPQSSSIALPQVDETVIPDFALRRLSYYHEFISWGDLFLWNLRLGLNPGHDLIGATQSGHGQKFVTMRDEMKAAHPEMYAIWEGKRATDHKDAGAVSLTSPMLKEKHLKYVRAVFDHFQEQAISLDPVDGIGRAISENDAEYATPERGIHGAMSDYVWGYIDEIAREIHKSHPDRTVAGSAYSAYQLPPEKIDEFSPNLAIAEARWRSNFHDKEAQAYHRKLREEWLAKLPSKKYITRDYYLRSRPEQAGKPAYFTRLISEDLRELKGVTLGENIEVYQHSPLRLDEFNYDEFAIEHLNLYVTSRLWWDADQDVDAILEDYYSAYFGPARDEMKAFIEYSEANWMKMDQEPEAIARAFELMEAAQEAAPPESVYSQRIERIANFIQPMKKLQEQLGRKRENVPSHRILLTEHIIETSMKDKAVDGRLDEAFYPKERRMMTVSKQLDGEPASEETQFQIFREDDMLYIGIRCSETDMANLNVPTSQSDDPKILEGDHVTVLIETSTHSYYEISVNPDGAVLERDHGNSEQGDNWGSGAEIAVSKADDFWNVEIALPIAGDGAKVLDPLHGMDGSRPSEYYPWYFNVGRQRVRDGVTERSAFSPTGTDSFHVLEKFAHLWGK